MFALPFKKTFRNSRRRGFSLVVALVMMALMLLIAISLVSFVYLESQIGGYRVKRYQAQANAVCGLRIALAQLQLLAGDDQRVTATADILDQGGTNKSLPSGTPYKGKRHWTGVWATGGLDKSDSQKLRDWDYKDPDAKPFLGWLVSGYDSDSGNFSPLDLPVAKSSADSDKGKEIVSEAVNAYDVDDDSPELVTLVGAGTLGKKSGWEDDVVKVRRVPLEKRTDFQRSAKGAGSFAYWVGDEGVKARVNLSDAYAREFDSSLNDFQRTLRATPQRVGAEVITGIKSFDDWWSADAKSAGTASAARLPYVLSLGDLAAYADEDSADFLKNARALYHDVSFWSRGVFSDVYSGGLKTDLSVAFEMPWFGGNDGFNKGFRDYPQFHGSGEKNGLNLLSYFSVDNNETTKWWLEQPSEGLGYVYEFDTKIAKRGNSDGRYLRGPTWDVFRNYYRLYKREVEKRGVRGLKASDDSTWLATGMAPYSYLQGDPRHVRESTSVNVSTGSGQATTQTYKGVFSPKWNYAAASWRGGMEYNNSAGHGGDYTNFVDAPTYLTEVSGDPDYKVEQGAVYANTSTGVQKGSAVIPQAMRLAPEVLRFSMKFSLIFNQDSAALIAEPLFVLHNPYNVPIEFFGLGMNVTKFYPFSLLLHREDGGKFWYWKNTYVGYNRTVGADGEYTGNTGNLIESEYMQIPFWFFSGNYSGKTAHSLYLFAGTSSYTGSPNGSIVMQPGEVKPVFAYSKQYPVKLKVGGGGTNNNAGDEIYGLANSLGNFEPDPEGGLPGFEIPMAFAKMKNPADLNCDFSISLGHAAPDLWGASGTAAVAQLESDMLLFYLFYPQSAIGENMKDKDMLTRTWNDPSSSSGWSDQADETLLQNISVSRISLYRYNSQRIGNQSSEWVKLGKSFYRESGTGWDGARKQALCVYEVYKGGAEDTPFAGPLLSNSRPWVVDPRSWNSEKLVDDNAPSQIGEKPRGNFVNAGPGWIAQIRTDGIDEMDAIEHTGDGQAYWGDSTGADGQTNVVLYEVPTRPMTSLGQFQSVDCSVLDYEPSYVVANSYPPIGLKDLSTLFDWPEHKGNKPPQQPRADTPFAANLALFDRYFFSGVNFGDLDGQQKNVSAFARKLLDDEAANPLANPRVSLIRDRSDPDRTDDVVTEELKDPNKVARNFLYEGAFNVNSTSVEAWKAQLASLHKQYLKIDGDYSEAEDFPIVRFMKLIGKDAGGEGKNNSGVGDSDGDEGSGWRWYRSLKDSELQSLAEKIVEEVRLRGPFMSMADFVNRRYNAKDDTARSGTLQAAIDKTSTINKSMGDAKNTPDSTQFPNLIPSTGKASKKAGAPGYLTQGDVISSLGAGMTVRSDTFTIRAYGDVFGLSGNAEARAYCEAVVQRLPDWVADEEDEVLESADKTIFDSLQVRKNYRSQSLGNDEHFFEKFERNTQLKAVNRLFGRRFKIVSFRWLTPDEI
ncbi:MAG: hypothetical protein ACI4P6_02775 [Candidatus Spyradosoma sp.]